MSNYQDRRNTQCRMCLDALQHPNSLLQHPPKLLHCSCHRYRRPKRHGMRYFHHSHVLLYLADACKHKLTSPKGRRCLQGSPGNRGICALPMQNRSHNRGFLTACQWVLHFPGKQNQTKKPENPRRDFLAGKYPMPASSSASAATRRTALEAGPGSRLEA